MALRADILEMFVVRAEHHAAGRQMVFRDLAHDLLDAARGGTETQMDPHAGAEFLEYFLIVGALMIRVRTRDAVGVQRVAGKERGVSVDRAVLEQRQLVKHFAVAGYRCVVIHYFAETDDARVVQERFHIFCGDFGAACFERGAGNAGREHKKDGQREPFRLGDHVLDALHIAYVGDLMRIGDDGCRTLFQNGVGKTRRMRHGGFDMDVSVDQAGAEIRAVRVDLLLGSGIGADSEDDAVTNRNIAFDDFFGEDVYDFSVFYDKSCVAAGCVENCSAET